MVSAPGMTDCPRSFLPGMTMTGDFRSATTHSCARIYSETDESLCRASRLSVMPRSFTDKPSPETTPRQFQAETKEALSLLYSHLSANDFHCAHAVLKHLGDTIPVTQELLDGTSGFIGGTAFKGLTCSAFTAGLMAIGLKLGEIEDSYLRVVRMLATMIAGGNAFADHMNKFNRVMNIGNRMSKWFTKEFGSTLCREVTQCDFSSLGDVHRYIEKGSVTTCKTIAEKVANQAERIILQKGVGF